MPNQPEISKVAAMFADSSRASILLGLLDGRSLSASRLAQEAGVSASTISGHLRQLLDHELVEVEEQGRNRFYRIGDPRVCAVVEALLAMTPTPAPTTLTSHNRMQRLRSARSCYDHAAGALGTDVMAGLVEVDALRRTDGRSGTDRSPADHLNATQPTTPYELGAQAANVFGQLGIDLDELQRERRPLLRVCLDWTEQRHHLAGNLGAAVLDGLLRHGWVERVDARRELRVLAPQQIHDWLTAAR